MNRRNFLIGSLAAAGLALPSIVLAERRPRMVKLTALNDHMDFFKQESPEEISINTSFPTNMKGSMVGTQILVPMLPVCGVGQTPALATRQHDSIVRSNALSVLMDSSPMTNYLGCQNHHALVEAAFAKLNHPEHLLTYHIKGYFFAADAKMDARILSTHQFTIDWHAIHAPRKPETLCFSDVGIVIFNNHMLTTGVIKDYDKIRQRQTIFLGGARGQSQETSTSHRQGSGHAHELR